MVNNQKINEYYKVSNIANKITTISYPKNTGDVIDGIKAKQLSTLPGEGGPATPVDEDDPMLKITEEAYRTYYWEATQNYTDLASYVTALDGIASTMLADLSVTEERRVLMYTEIETLKQYAIDLETNPDYWINLYGPQDSDPPSTSVVVTNSVMAVGGIGHFGNTIMGGVPPRQGCKISTRNVLMGSVIGGFVGAVGAAKVGAIAGTVVVPGIGTVTGAVSGFMAGFAAGFVGGVATGIVAELMLTCGR